MAHPLPNPFSNTLQLTWHGQCALKRLARTLRLTGLMLAVTHLAGVETGQFTSRTDTLQMRIAPFTQALRDRFPLQVG